MLHQNSAFELTPPVLIPPPAQSLGMIAYRSVAVKKPTDSALQELLAVSQRRNKAAQITGVLLYDRGTYFQWLEGPSECLERIWSSIRKDPRHQNLEVLREEPISERVFQGWSLRLTHGMQVSIEATVVAMESSQECLRRVISSPKAWAQMSVQEAFEKIVIPRLLMVHGKNSPAPVPLSSKAAIWHAEADCPRQFVTCLASPETSGPSRFIDSLISEGASFDALLKEVFEPAQLRLGQLWERDLCNDFVLAAALARLELQIRRVSEALPTEHVCRPMHRVLLSLQANETHSAGLLMSSQVFARKGWEVHCNIPGNDQALKALLQLQWFDVLHLSQSGVLRRDARLASIRESIDSVRAASMNSSLIVLVDGRTFTEQPSLYEAVHANAMCVTALDAASVAEHAMTNRVIPIAEESGC